MVALWPRQTPAQASTLMRATANFIESIRLQVYPIEKRIPAYRKLCNSHLRCYTQTHSAMPGSEREQRFLKAEHLVELQSAELKKELRLGDLVLSQILYITGLMWLGTAGKVGSSHVMYWIPAVLLFYIPSGIVVVHLNREMPLEGGLYQWVKLRFGDMAGFLVAMNLWATAVLLLASYASQIADNLAYAAGPSGAWIAENKSITMGSGRATDWRLDAGGRTRLGDRKMDS
jgi:hypothetical protein